MIDASPGQRLPGARAALALLLAINLFNYIDRYVLAAVLPKVGEQFGVGKRDQGLSTSMFLITYTVIAPLFGWLGDRWSRWKLIAIGVILWTLASGGTGLATTFAMLLLTRALIGVGEGAYGPVAPSLISDLFPVGRRGGVMAWFYMAIPVGSALGSSWADTWPRTTAGGGRFMSSSHRGFCSAFWPCSLRDPPRGAADAVTSHVPTFRDMARLLDIPSYVLNTLAMTAMTFAFGGVAVWMPSYLYEREATYVLTPTAYEQMLHPKDPTVPPVPEELIGRLQPLDGREYRTIEPFRVALNDVLSSDELLAWRGQIAEAARDEARSAKLDAVNGPFGTILAVAGLGATFVGRLPSPTGCEKKFVEPTLPYRGSECSSACRCSGWR